MPMDNPSFSATIPPVDCGFTSSLLDDDTSIRRVFPLETVPQPLGHHRTTEPFIIMRDTAIDSNINAPPIIDTRYPAIE